MLIMVTCKFSVSC